MNDEVARAVKRALDDREAQGLPRTVQDPEALAKVAALIRASATREAST